ncbi:MAG: zinc-binding dehydrogenase [Gammaproteobacteria bacterium]
MKAIHMTAAGGPEVLQLVDVPEPEITEPQQIKVRLHAAGINPIDTKLRSRGVFFDGALPAILGCDGAGEVVEVGPAVHRFQVGDRVWFCHGGLGREPGNYAEYKVLPEDEAATMPHSLDYAQAAAGPLVLITAWEALHDRARIEPGQHTLILAGAGGVGHVAIQLAALAGGDVATTVSTDEKAALAVRRWTDDAGADIVLDTVGGQVFRDMLPAVAHYGDLVTLLDPGTEVDWREARTRNLRISFELMLTPMMRDLPEARALQIEILEDCADLIDSGDLKLHVGATLPLAEAAEAHRLVEAGHMTGKVVLTIP